MPWKTLKHHGIVTDFPPEEAAEEAWTDGQNVGFELGVSARAPGYARFAAPVSAAPIFALNVIVEAVSWWLYCSASEVWVTDGIAHYNITPAAGLSPALANEWTGCVINGIPVLNNTHNAPMWWDLNPTHPCTALPGWPTGATCQAMRAHKYHLFALAVEDAGELQESTLWWSSGAQPGQIPQEWTPTASNDAGDMVLADTPGAIIDGASLRDTFVVYKAGSVYVLSYVAGQYIYTQRKLYLADGLAARNCIAEHAGWHYIFTGSDVMRHDGQNAESVVIGRTKRRLVQSINSARLEQCFLTLHRLTQTLMVGIPVGSADLPNRLFTVDLTTGDNGIRDIAPTAHIARGVVRLGAGNSNWDADAQAWDADASFWNEQDFSPTDDSLLAAMPGVPALMAMGTSAQADGAPMSAMLEKTGITLDQADIRRALVRRIALRVEGTPGDVISVRVGGQPYFSSPIAWAPAVPLTIGSVQVLDVLAEGRLMALRLEATTDNVWRVHSYKLEYDYLGDY